MGPLKNIRHEKFAQLVAGGMSATKSYSEAGYEAKDADVAGPRLLGNVGVAARIAELRKESEQSCKISREEVLAFLADVIKTPAGHVHKESPLCQSFKDTEDCNEVRMPDKLGSIAQLCKMLPQWLEPERVDSKLEIIIRKL
jgi:hypothetical protein